MPKLPHMHIRIPSALLLGAIVLSAASVRAADCNSLRSLKLPDTNITLAESVVSGNLSVSATNPPLQGLPKFCRVTGVIRPSSDSEIRFEVWMPQDWNGRFLGVGNGGFAGAIGYPELARDLARGFATAGSDTGHMGGAEDASWAFEHPEKIKDFGWRAVHLTTERAKEIVAAYYGQSIRRAYFDSCSDGGREALMEAQRFPEDYDGILAGAPANAWTHLLTGSVSTTESVLGDPRGYVSSLKLPAIQRAALSQCDALDGVKDGIISNPEACRFDPSVLLCKGEESQECLTQPQINSLKKYYSGGTDDRGKRIFPGLTPGDETGWRAWEIGDGPGDAAVMRYVENYFRYMVTDDPKWNILTADVSRSLQAAMQKTAADLDATNPDLSRFAARGGRLILYHGWNDPAISPWNTVAYYRSVKKQMGDQSADSFVRLYMVPGMEHCAGGPGPDAFGQLGLPAAKGPKGGIFDALQEWVEKGTPPAEVIAAKYRPDKSVLMTRPLCPYPKIAKYKGAGDTNDAANFTCSD